MEFHDSLSACLHDLTPTQCQRLGVQHEHPPKVWDPDNDEPKEDDPS